MAYDIVCPHCGKRDYYHESWCKVWDNHHTRKEKPVNDEVENIAKALERRSGGPLNSPFDPLAIEAAKLLRKVRNDALEEALECFDFNSRQPRSEIYAAIRALKDKQP